MPTIHPLRRILLPLATTTALAALVAFAPAATAANTSPSVSPSSISEASSPAFTFNWTVTNPGPGRVIGAGLDGFTISGDEATTPVRSGSTVTCTFASGILATWTSAGFTAGTSNSGALCEIYQWVGFIYVELNPANEIAIAPGAVSLQVSAGALQAPATSGRYAFEAYVWNGSYLDQGFGSIAVGLPDEPSTDTGTGTVIRQSVPVPSTGLCADVVDGAYAWGTGVTGGWQRAWEPWAGPADAGGGWACSRALVTQGAGRWTVNNNAL